MAKILSKAGESLADVYDVRGSIAGVDDLVSEEVHLVHEMGATIFSERYGQLLIGITPGAIGQSINWNVNLALGPNMTRVLQTSVVSDVTARIQHMQLSMSDVLGITVIRNDCPFWVWSTGSGDDIEKPIRLMQGGVVSTVRWYQAGGPIGHQLMGTGTEQGLNSVGQLAFRGQTSAFGAGTVTPTALVVIGETRVGGGLSSRGLPLPSW